MKRFYCTYFDRNYLVKGASLLSSLERHGGDEYQVFALCLDETTGSLLESLKFKNVVAIPLGELEREDPALREAKRQRTAIEYYWTLTPTLILRILEMHPEVDLLTYLDADLFFYSSPEPILDECGNHSIMIQEHRFSPSLKYLEKYGRYNVGWIGFRNDESARAALQWWRERCLEWCHIRLEDGKFGDQLYLDDWTTRFRGVTVLKNRSAGVAPWNHDQYEVSADPEGRVLVDGEPLIFYHFHGLSLVGPGVIVPAVHHHPLSEEILRFCHIPYIRSVERWIAAVREIRPGFSFGLSERDILTTAHAFLAKTELRDPISKSGIPQVPFRIDDEWDCFSSPQIVRFSERNSGVGELLKMRDFKTIRHVDIHPGETEENALALNREGERCFDRGDMEGAASAFRRAALIDGRIAEIHNNLGVVYWLQGRLQESLQEFTKVFEIDPRDSTATLNCGEIFQRLGNPSDAEKVYLCYLQHHPDDEEVSACLHRCRSGISGVGPAARSDSPMPGEGG